MNPAIPSTHETDVLIVGGGPAVGFWTASKTLSKPVFKR